MAEEKKLCPKCDKEIPAGADECPFCKFDLVKFNSFGDLMDVYRKSRTPKEDERPAKKSGVLDDLLGNLGGKKK
jgi:hypothetical protein